MTHHPDRTDQPADPGDRASGPERDAGGASPPRERFCPFCDALMSEVEAPGKVRIEGCAHCGATWYDKGELRLVRRLRGQAHEKERTLRRRSSPVDRDPLVCPRCDLPTLRMRRVGLTPIATCDSCKGTLLPDRRLSEHPRLMKAFRAPAEEPGILALTILLALLAAFWLALG